MADYYQENHRSYYEATRGIDPAFFLAPFVARLKPECRILDVGCGSGRDLLWLKNLGFVPTGFERAPGLAALARAHSGCPVIEGDFQTHDFSGIDSDAILMSGALVHLDPLRFSPVLKNILKALHPGRSGIIYISLKQGQGAHTDDRGRIFHYWQDASLRTRFAALDLSILDFLRSPSADGTGSTWLGYVLRNEQESCEDGHRFIPINFKA
jgi:SAM-dependent methyltransferase